MRPRFNTSSIRGAPYAFPRCSCRYWRSMHSTEWVLGSHRRAIVVLVLVNIAHTQPKGIQTYDEAYYSSDLIAQEGINTTTREEYEPRTVYHRPVFDSVLLKGVRSSPEVTQLAANSTSQSFKVNASAPRADAGFSLRLSRMDGAGR